MSMYNPPVTTSQQWWNYGRGAWWELVHVYHPHPQGNEPVFVRFKIRKDQYPDHFLWLRVEGTRLRPSGRSDDSRDSRSRSPPLPSARSHRRTEPPAAHEHSHAMNRQQRAAAEHHRRSSPASWRSRGTTESSRSWGNESWSIIEYDLRAGGNHNSDSRPNSR